MTATMLATKQIVMSDQTADTARHLDIPRGAALALRTQGGEDVALPPAIQRLLLSALESLADGNQVTIGRVPKQLTSTVAADMLGVSRPTLMKWVRDGVIDSFKVGSHTRFDRDEVARVRNERIAQRRASFRELRDLEAEHAHLIDA
ncbi:helix-turn-helix domain-containing protein [Brachybacterium paraconglomeratum]|uniref:helix-turn-helix domain-containing protein n=1 Tax=Brachybacterium paraconglomeratum TaxID=173362 RepID=UPI00387916EE